MWKCLPLLQRQDFSLLAIAEVHRLGQAAPGLMGWAPLCQVVQSNPTLVMLEAQSDRLFQLWRRSHRFQSASFIWVGSYGTYSSQMWPVSWWSLDATPCIIFCFAKDNTADCDCVLDGTTSGSPRTHTVHIFLHIERLFNQTLDMLYFTRVLFVI